MPIPSPLPRLPYELVVPGSISNLGPAFDTLSVAVDLYLRVRVVEILPDAPDTIATAFSGPAPAGDNRIETAYRQARDRFGQPAPGVRLEVQSDIPVRAGLGSSGAATIESVYELYPIGSGAAAKVPGLKGDEVIIAWATDGNSLVIGSGLLPARVERLDLRSGRRDLIRTIAPTNVAGALNIAGLTVADDPNVYAYYINQELSRLFLITGAR